MFKICWKLNISFGEVTSYNLWVNNICGDDENIALAEENRQQTWLVNKRHHVLNLLITATWLRPITKFTLFVSASSHYQLSQIAVKSNQIPLIFFIQ